MQWGLKGRGGGSREGFSKMVGTWVHLYKMGKENCGQAGTEGEGVK